jgi:hypothetical protein
MLPRLDTGKEIYEAACSACHGTDGKGMPDATIVFEKPKTYPDFSRCDQTTPELDVDWKATIRDGGSGRGLSHIMPAFGDALTSKQIDKVIQYLRGFCVDSRWPRGEFNLPLPLETEKAYPEDEVIVTSATNLQRTPGVTNDIIYEQRFGVRNQIEIDVPIAFNRALPGLWYGGLGDATIGAKRVLWADLHSGTILSGFGGIVLPSGDREHGLGSGVTQFEMFASGAQLLPHQSFIQAQGGVDQPSDTRKLPRSVFWRAAFGKSFRQSNGTGRMWTPMLEFVGNRDSLRGSSEDVDIVPELQVTLSRRQHIRANIGFRVPMTNASDRPVEAIFYVLWDWFDGSLKDGWRK